MISILQTSIKEKKQRLQYKTTESHRRYLKFMKMQATTIGYMPLYTPPKARFKNYCLVSGRARSVYSKKFRLSRHQIKHYFSFLKSLRISAW
jgi:ribosomal protein S14